jgi:perosamine synthetase
MKRMGEQERRYVGEVLANAFSTSQNCTFINRLEAAFAKAYHRRFAISFINGTATLHTALAALRIGAGDEVIVPPLTMASTSLAVLHNRSVPVFADVERDTFNLSPASVQRWITKKSRAIITVALYGLAPDYDAILAICREYKLALIEDNAETFFSRYKGKLAGEFGDFASFSFQASKHLTCGEGGMLVCQNERLADAARRFSSLGYAGVAARQGKISRNDVQDPRYARHVCFGWNYRMSELQAAVALGQLERAETLVKVRTNAARILEEAVSQADWLIPQRVPEGCTHTYWSYSVLMDVKHPEKQWYQFRDLFARNGGDGIYAAWKLTYQEPFFRNEVQSWPGVRQNYCPGLCPQAEYLQKRMLQFKTNYWNLKEAEKQAEILTKTIKDFERCYL